MKMMSGLGARWFDSGWLWVIVGLLLGVFLYGCGDDAGADPVFINEDELGEGGDGNVVEGKAPAAVCGDGVCNGKENAGSCSEDCLAQCRDGYCTHDESAWTCPADCKPATVTVRFQQALIGPVKSDGCQWDGLTCNPLSGKELEQFSGVISSPIFSGILAIYQAGVFDALQKPDPKGTVMYEGTGETHQIGVIDDSFMMPFGVSAVFRNVRYAPSMMFQVGLWDQDIMKDDLIWQGSLRFGDMEKALLSGEDYWIDLRRTSSNQLVGILVSVTPGTD